MMSSRQNKSPSREEKTKSKFNKIPKPSKKPNKDEKPGRQQSILTPKHCFWLILFPNCILYLGIKMTHFLVKNLEMLKEA